MKTPLKRSRNVLLLFFAVAALLVFVKTKLDEHNYAGLDNSFSEMYYDRLVVESYIYKLNDLIHKKKLVLIEADNSISYARLTAINTEIDQLITAYALTKLTPAEKGQFESFRSLIVKIHATEAASSGRTADAATLIPLYDDASFKLRGLSDIQVSQGRYLATQSHSTVASSLLAIRLEWALYVLILAVLVALYKKREITSPQWPAHLMN
jgi:hypothetical protein